MQENNNPKLSEIWTERRKSFEEKINSERTKAREIAERLCKAALVLSDMEMEKFQNPAEKFIKKEVIISDKDSDSVRKFDPVSTLCKTGNQIIREEAETYLKDSNSPELDIEFSYSEGGCAGNEFFIVLKKKEGDK